MFNVIKRLFLEGKITKNGLNNAVKRGVITKEQFKEITEENYM